MSWYLPERRALLLHVPRTGGTWVKEALHVMGVPLEKWGKVCPLYRPRKHTILPHYHPTLLTKVDYIFAFVRYPVAYYVSVWRFTCRAVKIHPEKMQRDVFEQGDPAAINEAIRRWKPDFREWLLEMLEEEPGWATRWFERYVGPEGGEFCHFVGRTETLEEDTKHVAELLGYGDRWDENREAIQAIHHAKNRIRKLKAPNVEVPDDIVPLLERSERVMLRRFYGEGTKNRRVYRETDGTPVRFENG